ncbi:pseudouridine synthase [Aliirhizobium smilacinae]|uniref:Dual-specificity RNA pseudouridine synthase RluA n=1 Tax=Aliirhizobium smilacinae TaxID=1395944 RepID=A0A5C4XKD9_9HYPH|nr:pseudouridine synthase [Rhizobium smilacinae]TNM63100.1 RNA pseudouridine synthase [Rhizobium smilacinae]
MNVLSDVSPIYNPPMDPYVTVLYRDRDFLVCDKPSGLLSVPGRHPALSDSLLTRVQKDFPEALIVHRLDKDTSGIVLMSLNRKAHAFVAQQFETRTTRKSYVAEVWGRVEGEEGTIDLPLAIDPDNKPRHRVDYEHGKPALTRWQVLGFGENRTRLRLFPMTGRTHQLRVHMKSMGHVILGDEFYAEGEALAAADRLLLHAEELTFRKPDGSDVTFTAPTPF